MSALHPPNLDEHSRRLLQALALREDTAGLVIGGGTALLHYTRSHRETFDLDFWWDTSRRDPKKALCEEVDRIADALGAKVHPREARDGTLTLDIRERKKRGQVTILTFTRVHN